VKLAGFFANLGANFAIQDGVQDGHRFLPVQAKTFCQVQKFNLQ